MGKPKHDFDEIHRDNLPADVKQALASFRNDLVANRLGGYRIFENDRPTHYPLPKPAQGCEYREVQVGEARPDDPLSERGIRRLVVEINKKSLQVCEMYFTGDHYATFRRIVPRPRA